MNKTIIDKNINRKCDGYLFVSMADASLESNVVAIQKQFAERFSSDLFWFPKSSAIHVTIAHIVSPLSAYSKEQIRSFPKKLDEASEAMRAAIQSVTQPTIGFAKIQVFPEAIVLIGTDDGSIQQLRGTYTQGYTPFSATRQPPTIIHSTLARFRREIDLGEIQDFADSIYIDFQMTMHEIQLVHETEIYLDGFEILRTFKLSDKEQQ